MLTARIAITTIAALSIIIVAQPAAAEHADSFFDVFVECSPESLLSTDDESAIERAALNAENAMALSITEGAREGVRLLSAAYPWAIVDYGDAASGRGEGATTLEQLPSGDFAVDSFFDITYQIDFCGDGVPIDSDEGRDDLDGRLSGQQDIERVVPFLALISTGASIEAALWLAVRNLEQEGWEIFDARDVPSNMPTDMCSQILEIEGCFASPVL